MNIAVPSRFACLKIEDDDGKPKEIPTTNKKKTINKKNPVISLKKGNIKQKTTSRKITAKNRVSEQQWEEWKKKDIEIVKDSFEQDMEIALLQSKLEYEASATNINSAIDVKESINNKKKKSKTLQLSEFLNGNNEIKSNSLEKEKKNEAAFFDEMKEAATREISKGILADERKERDINFEQTINLAQFEEKMFKVEMRNKELEKELSEVKTELNSVKERNKIFCAILGQSEIKEKSELIVELDRLNKIRDELTEEVTHLHKQLEKERSKNGGNASKDYSSIKTKEKGKK